MYCFLAGDRALAGFGAEPNQGLFLLPPLPPPTFLKQGVDLHKLSQGLPFSTELKLCPREG
jgi:hypothetical protein